MSDYMQKFHLDGRTAFVVGGLGLIGREVSIAIASAGAKIIVLDVDDSDGPLFEIELRGEGYEVACINFDCSEVKKLDENFSAVIDEFGCPDVFINCSYPRTADWGKSSFKKITLESFQKNVDMHMNSYAWLARLAAEAMVVGGSGGNIIQLGSTYGVVGQDLVVYEGTEMHENMTYATIKGGITNLTRLMASYYGQFNIRVNTLCPGGLEGPVAEQSATQDSRFVKNYTRKTPLKRLGKADEIASVALFLASDASSYITGATIMVDGGWTAV
jgi:NAD(P)-dependent dehydrogenase (short-subunit alcohol dehydrogenase family)